MFSVKETPWHGLGKIVREAPTAAAAIELAGLNWAVSPEPVYKTNLKSGTVDEIKSHRAIVRETDQSVLGVVGKNYTPLQNSEAFEFFNPFVEAGLASFESAGSLREGRNVWVLAKLSKRPIEIGKGDEVNKFLLLSNGHDGTMAIRVGFTPIRVVCANTLSMAHGDHKSKLLRLFHSKNVKMKLDEVQDAVNAADVKFEATAELYRKLLKGKTIDKKRVEKYVSRVFGFSLKEADERREFAREKMNETIMRLFETGRGSELPSARGTYWGLYNAAAEYLSYERGKNEATRLKSLWFDSGLELNKKALDTALEMAVR